MPLGELGPEDVFELVRSGRSAGDAGGKVAGEEPENGPGVERGFAGAVASADGDSAMVD